MFRLRLTSVPYALFFILTSATAIPLNQPELNAQELKKKLEEVYIKLLLSKHSESAERFLKALKTKHAQAPQPAPLPTHPIEQKSVEQEPKKEMQKEPAISQKQPTPPSQQITQPLPKAGAPLPQAITEHEKAGLNTIFTVLESNSMGIHACLDAFFCKDNCQPYATHVTCFKSQLTYLQDNLLNTFPQAEASERRKIFTEFQKLASILQQSEIALLKVVDQAYVASYMGVLQLAAEFYKAEPILEAFKKQANALINILKRSFKQDGDILKRLAKLQTNVNRMYNFGTGMSKMEAMNIMSHRLSR